MSHAQFRRSASGRGWFWRELSLLARRDPLLRSRIPVVARRGGRGCCLATFRVVLEQCTPHGSIRTQLGNRNFRAQKHHACNDGERCTRHSGGLIREQSNVEATNSCRLESSSRECVQKPLQRKLATNCGTEALVPLSAVWILAPRSESVQKCIPATTSVKVEATFLDFLSCMPSTMATSVRRTPSTLIEWRLCGAESKQP